MATEGLIGGLSWWLNGKESASKAGDPGCNPGSVLPFIALFETVISHLIQRMGINAW